MSQITTHVLDTAIGKPAEGIAIKLQRFLGDDQWEELANGLTNSDGRIANLLAKEQVLEPGIYQMVFDTGSYFKQTQTKAFYPFVHIAFEMEDSEHYHVPLLLNPFGYSTYRGS